jgi:transcriptional regulator with XRE-family HTH domain
MSELKNGVFAVVLRKLRETSGLSQRQLAQRAGLSVGAVRQYEHDRREPSYTALCRLAGGLGVSLSAFDPPPDLVLPVKEDQKPRLAILEGKEVSEGDLASLFECLAGRKPDRQEKARARKILAARDGEKPAARSRKGGGKGR